MGPVRMEVVVFALILLALAFNRHARDNVRDYIENFRRGGGPPRPMHPSPANDRALLRKPLQRRSDR